ncbi:hypothetical protein VNO77_15681 [Canavalia gladiata]|uniref:Uncharacterized protein n=1 Tax=Canavalia gladiata TaxID=3824 RepID=A0AAN9LZU7_CANGL
MLLLCSWTSTFKQFMGKFTLDFVVADIYLTSCSLLKLCPKNQGKEDMGLQVGDGSHPEKKNISGIRKYGKRMRSLCYMLQYQFFPCSNHNDKRGGGGGYLIDVPNVLDGTWCLDDDSLKDEAL